MSVNYTIKYNSYIKSFGDDGNMNESKIQDVFRLNKESGFVRHNGIRVTEAQETHCIVEAKLGPKTSNIFGMPHGGLLFLLADTSAGALARVRGLSPSVTVDAYISYVSASENAKYVYACSEIVREGGRLCFYDVRIYDDSDFLLAVAHITMKRVKKVEEY